MSKPKGGLQKKVSSIFDGVPMESDAARSSGRHIADTAGNLPAVEAKTAAPSPVATPAPVTSTPAVKPPVMVAPTVWPKAPAIQPEPEKPKVEPKPKSALTLAMAADADTTAPALVPKSAPTKFEPPRPPSRVVAEKPVAAPAPAPTHKVMGKVVVKRSGTENNKKTAMLVGALAVLLVLALLYSGGYLSGGKSTAINTTTPVQQAALVPAKIDWQRPSMMPLKRDPFRPGPGRIETTPGTNQKPADTTSSPFAVTALFWSQDKSMAMINDRDYVSVGDVYGEAKIKILAITKDYVEYEQEGAKKRGYVRNARNHQTGPKDLAPDANSQNIK
jgi:hypothetical protein